MPESNKYLYKTFNDPIHGSIGLSEVECAVIATEAFGRLAGLKQLGLAYLVFPGATHTRFAHSLGVTHVMSRMIDAINVRAEKDGDKKPITEDDKERLRLAALLHDIGHYPLSHATETVFYKSAHEAKSILQPAEHGVEPTVDFPFQQMASVKKHERVTHERLGALIVEHNSELSSILRGANHDPREIATIFTGEYADKPLFSQLIHSTLDADRIDFLLRDSLYAGVIYGHVDIDFLIGNLVYDKDEELFGVDYKGITTFEHFLIARYYMYNNITYHKTVVALEFMAQLAYYEMSNDGLVVGNFDELRNKIDSAWLGSFDDTYFWDCLKKWEPGDPYFKCLRDALLHRRPLTLLYEERRLGEGTATDDEDSLFTILRKDSFNYDTRYQQMCDDMGLDRKSLSIVPRKIKFESQPPLTPHRTSVSPEEGVELGKVYEGHRFRDLIEVEWAIIKELSKRVQYVRRLYYFDKDNNAGDKRRIRDKLEAIFCHHN